MTLKRKTSKVQLKLRFNRQLHREIKRAAKRNGRALNIEINRRLEESFQADSLVDLVKERLDRGSEFVANGDVDAQLLWWWPK